MAVASESKSRKIPRKFTMPWGNGQVVEEVGIATEHNELVIQLLRYDDGTTPDAVRFCQYWLDGRFQRQPMMLGTGDIGAMRKALAAAPTLQKLLRELVS